MHVYMDGAIGKQRHHSLLQTRPLLFCVMSMHQKQQQQLCLCGGFSVWFVLLCLFKSSVRHITDIHSHLPWPLLLGPTTVFFYGIWRLVDVVFIATYLLAR